MAEQAIVNKTVLQGPSRIRLAWMRLLCDLHYMPKAVIVVNDGDKNRTMKITYRVYWRYYFGIGEKHREGFQGIPVKVEASDGDILFDGRAWTRVSCDEIFIDPSTRQGWVHLNTANTSF